MLKVEHAPLAVTAFDDDAEVEVVKRIGAAFDPGVHGEVKIPLGAVWGLITGGHVIGAVEVRRDIGAIAEVELQTELDISIVVHKDVVAGGCVACADVCVVAWACAVVG